MTGDASLEPNAVYYPPPKWTIADHVRWTDSVGSKPGGVIVAVGERTVTVQYGSRDRIVRHEFDPDVLRKEP